MRLVPAVLIGVIAASSAWGAVYEWVDRNGVVNMTDDPDKVPPAYRKSMKAREIDTKDQVPPAVERPNEPARSGAGESELELYGGLSGQSWRSSFQSARAGIRNLQKRIEADKKSLDDLHHQRVVFQRPSDRIAYFSLADQITREEEELKTLQQNLVDLGARADSAGVPLSWRGE